MLASEEQNPMGPRIKRNAYIPLAKPVLRADMGRPMLATQAFIVQRFFGLRCDRVANRKTCPTSDGVGPHVELA